jgi:hypothetical protein
MQRGGAECGRATESATQQAVAADGARELRSHVPQLNARFGALSPVDAGSKVRQWLSRS